MVTRIDWKNCQSHWTVSTMGINFRALLPFLLFYVFKGSSAQSVVVSYTNKLVETLECSFTSSVTIVQWIDQSDDGNPITVFLYDVSKGLAQKQTNYSKYENFNYTIDGTNGFNLVITNVDRGDGGRYLCNRILPSSFVTFDVTVEVLPESISIDCTEFDCMPPDERQAVPQINCVCTATGLSSSVLEIEWEGVDVSSASNTARVMDSTPESFSISSNITFRPPDGTFSLSCLLTGYKSQIPESLLRSSTHTFSPPVCNLEHVCPSDGTNASLICSCSNGSPKVKAYSFYDSQKLPIGKQCTSSKSVQVDANKMEMFYCSGHNGVHNQLVEHEFNCKQGSVWWIIIVILLLLVVAAIIFVVVKKCWKKYRLSKQGVAVEPVQKPKGGGATEPLLYENTSVQEQQKVQGPGGMNSEPLKGGPATKKDDKGMNTVPSKDGPATKKNDKGKGPLSSGGDQGLSNNEKKILAGSSPVYADVNRERGKTGPTNETQTQPTGSKGASNKTKPNEETSKEEDKQENVEPGLSKGEDDNKDSKEKEEEEKPESAERLGPEGKETTVNGQENVKPGVSGGENDNTDSEEKEKSEIDAGSQGDSGARQSEKDVGSQVDSGKRERDTLETPATGNQLRSPQAVSATKYKELPHGYNYSNAMAGHVPVDDWLPDADMTHF